jgi:sodium/potassium-transporting ATPase subunit alpha
MITGDHPLTALAVAREIGLVAGQGTEDANALPTVIEGTQLDHLSDEQLRELLKPSPVGSPPLFARMAPRHKLRVVSTLKNMGEIVAVTGDGVNDAPALKQADIGVAMGLAGADVAKETADMILLDDNFATIVYAIEEGRTVYDNIRKFSTYILASNVPEIVPFLGYGLAGWPLALTIPQVLAVDLGTDMIPALGLGAERPQADVMDRPPRNRRERMLNLPLLLRAYLFLGMIEAATAMTAFFLYLTNQGWVWGTPLDWSSPLYREATTVALAAIVLAQVANVFACRSDHLSTARLGWFSNPLILWGILAELAIFALVAYTPIGNRLFGTSPLPLWIFGPLTIGGAGLLLAEEIRKLFVNRLMRRPSPLAQRELPA